MLKIFKNFKTKEWILFSISILFIVSQVWLDLKLPDYMSEITKLVQTPGSEMSEIITAGGWMLLCALGSLVASIIVAAFVANIATELASNLRIKMFDKVQSFSMEEINSFSSASLITRSTNDITQVQTFIVMGLQALVKAPILAVWAILKITGRNFELSLVIGVSVLVLLIFVGTCIVIALPKFKMLQKLTDNLNRVARENLTGISVTRAVISMSQMRKMSNLFTSRVLATLMPTITLIMNGVSLAIYWIGAILIENAQITDRMNLFSDVVVFSSYAMQVLIAFMMLVVVFILMPRATVAAKRINEVLGTESKIKNGTTKESPIGLIGEVEFKNVSFMYPDSNDYVLKNISFKANRGETIAFIGATGSGKSTLINLIPRFYDVTDGEILINGVNVKEYDQKHLRNKLGYISQKVTLFKGTVGSNVAFGENGKAAITQNDVANAVYVAQATEFVENLDGDYNAHISQGGSNLSGGQKQRLSIARAIARCPEILIFDDSFSALDYKTDSKLRKLLKKENAGTTMLIVGQRISSIKDADKIIVLEDGKMVGIGKHDELMKSCDVYKEIAHSQLSKDELTTDSEMSYSEYSKEELA